MTSNEQHPLSDLARSQLSVLDATLRGDAVAPEHAELAELALLLRDDRPRPHPTFTATLDHHVADREARSAPRERPASRRPAWLSGAALPAGIATIVVIAAAATAIALLGTGAPGHQHAVTAQAAIGSLAQPRAVPPATAGAVAETARAPHDFSAQASAGAPRAVEHTTTLRVGVARRQIESADQQIFSIISSFHGYVQQSSATSGSEQEGSASFQLRVPSANIQGALAAMSQLGRVLSETNTTSDVTEQLDSLQRALGDAQAERTGLLTQIAHTSQPGRAATLRAQLAQLESRISSLRASLGSLNSQVDYTPIALTLAGEAPSRGTGSGGDLTPGGAVRDAGDILTTALAVLLIAIAATLPVAIAVALGWGALASTRRRQRERALDDPPVARS